MSGSHGIILNLVLDEIEKHLALKGATWTDPRTGEIHHAPMQFKDGDSVVTLVQQPPPCVYVSMDMATGQSYGVMVIAHFDEASNEWVYEDRA